jgi:hypothetical protein
MRDGVERSAPLHGPIGRGDDVDRLGFYDKMGLMRMRIASFLALSLALGTVFCSTAPTPPLGTCCVLTASDGTIDCYCRGISAEGGVVSTVVVSGSTCTVTFTSTSDDGGMSDGGAGVPHKGYPPAVIADCMPM